MESKREDLKASEDRIRKLKERSRHQDEKIGWLDMRINELQELGFTEAKYNPLNYEERVLENQMLYDEITGLSQKIKDLENLHKEIQDECSEDLEHKMREKQKITKELEGLKNAKKDKGEASVRSGEVEKGFGGNGSEKNVGVEESGEDMQFGRGVGGASRKESNAGGVKPGPVDLPGDHCQKLKKVNYCDVTEIGKE